MWVISAGWRIVIADSYRCEYKCKENIKGRCKVQVEIPIFMGMTYGRMRLPRPDESGLAMTEEKMNYRIILN